SSSARALAFWEARRCPATSASDRRPLGRASSEDEFAAGLRTDATGLAAALTASSMAGKGKTWLHPGHLTLFPSARGVLVLRTFLQAGQENRAIALPVAT